MAITDINKISRSSDAEFARETEVAANAPEAAQTSDLQISGTRSPEALSQQFLRSRMSVGSAFMQQQLSSRLSESRRAEPETDGLVESAESVSQQDNDLADLNDAINQLSQLILILFGGSNAWPQQPSNASPAPQPAQQPVQQQPPAQQQSAPQPAPQPKPQPAQQPVQQQSVQQSEPQPASQQRMIGAGSSSLVGLSRGDVGTNVASLQRKLVNLGYYRGSRVDGIFGPITEREVRRFQMNHGLRATGAVDSGTAAAIERALSNVSTGLRRGDFGAEVIELQEKMGELGYYPSWMADGIFGPKTEGAVRQFQANHGMQPTGIVDSDTESAIDGAVAQSTGKPEGRQIYYDGTRPAPGTTDTHAARPLNAPIKNSASDRSAENYANVINQFAVGVNPRYARRNGNTYCNIFAWDVTRAMGAEIPHWVDGRGNPTPFGVGYEQNANSAARWLSSRGSDFGWRRVSAQEAQYRANQGYPTVFSWNNPGGIGHIGVVRPGEFTERGPEIAQSGAINTNDTHIGNIFDDIDTPTYWVHA